MQADTNQTQPEVPRGDSGGYMPAPQQPQQPGDFYGAEREGQPGSYQQYNQPYGGYQPYSQGPQQQQQQQQYGYQQPYGAPPSYDVGPFELTSLGMRTRTAGWLCYLFGWVTGLIFFLLEKQNRFVRFHAMQSILFFGGMSILEGIVRFFETLFSYSLLPVFGFGAITGVLGIITFVCWIVLMVQASKGRYYKLPVIGDYAEKIANQFSL